MSNYFYDFEDLLNSIELHDLYKIMMAYDAYHLHQILSYEIFCQMLDIVICENYLFNDVAIFQQFKGIPMGGGARSTLGDIYLNNYASLTSNFDKCLVMRYVDDIVMCVLKNSSETKFYFWYYPLNLKLLKNSISLGGKVVLLDLNISINNQDIVFQIYDKQDL